MNNTLIQMTRVYMQACIKRMLAAIALIIALTCPHAKALESSPHWEDVDGLSRYGYWQEVYAGYTDDSAGYWDYSAGDGHFVAIIINQVYDDQGNFVSEETVEIWVPDPVWVAQPVWVPGVIIWIDVESSQTAMNHSTDLSIDIRPDNGAAMAGRKVWCSLSWRIDESGGVVDKSYSSDIYPSEIVYCGVTYQFGTGGNVFIDGNPGDIGAQLRLHGNAWTTLDLLQSGVLAIVLNEQSEALYPPIEVSTANLSGWDINWDMNLNMAYNGYSQSVGSLSGWHNKFPSYKVEVDGQPIYDFMQGGRSLWGVLIGLLLSQDVSASF